MAKEETDITLSHLPRRILFWLVGCIVILILVSIIVDALAYYTSREVRVIRLMHLKLDINAEYGIAAWFSSALILGAGVLLVMIGRMKRHSTPGPLWWFILAAIMVFLSIDEATMIHEPVGKFVFPDTELPGFLKFRWMIPYGLATLVVGLVYLRFLFLLPARTRWIIIAAGLIYLIGAMGVEFIESAYVYRFGREPGYGSFILTTSQEAMEMFGMAIFIYALTDYLVGLIQHVRLAPSQ